MTIAQPGKQAHLYALLFLGCAIAFTFYRWQYSPRTDAADGLASLSSMLRLDVSPEPKPEIHAASRGATVPDLLSRVQEIASADNITIRSVTPSPAMPDQISLGVDGGFRDLVRFMARLETLQVSISSFDIAPGENDGTTATIGITRAAKPGVPIRLPIISTPFLSIPLSEIPSRLAIRSPCQTRARISAI